MGMKSTKRRIEKERLRFWTAKADSAEIERKVLLAMPFIGTFFEHLSGTSRVTGAFFVDEDKYKAAMEILSQPPRGGKTNAG